jgi:hypothetical protein
MIVSRLSCLTCGGSLFTCNLPVSYRRGNECFSVTIRFYGCFSCGKYVTSADQLGTHGTLQTVKGSIIEVVADTPYSAS